MVAVFFKTSQFNIINLALSDIFKSSFQIFGIIPALNLMVNRSSCTSEIIFNVIRHFLFILSKCFVALISYDRYQHVKRPNRYTQIMTFKKVKRFQMAISCSCVIHSWCLISQFYSLEVDSTFACDDSFTSNRNCSWLFLYKINTAIKPTQLKESEVFQEHHRMRKYSVCFPIFYCTGCYNIQHGFTNKIQIFHLLVETSIC